MSAAYQQNPYQFAAPPAANPAPQYGQYPQQQYSQQPQTPQQQHQLVVATQPSNPYAGMVAPQAPASYDPFAAPPATAPATYAPAPAPVYPSSPAQPRQQYGQAPAPPQDPWAAQPGSQSFSAPPPPQQAYGPAPAPAPTDYQVPTSYTNDNGWGNSGAMVPVKNEDENYEKNKQLRNPYSNQLAQTVSGKNASSLPKAELVGKKGHVLSRISFRTIVMKKWKQSYWVQYGGHTMLWFRNEADFNDWLNNPYHTQMQRNFLIKLAINFVHDLYKPNVRGYQVTQCRTKPYGNNKVVRQFKLERWMDYGPTIAAAFGSYDPKEVDACREAIVECMKNTPLDNGIRATGAVKEHHERKQQEEMRQLQQHQNGGAYNNYSVNNSPTKGSRAMSVPEFDLLGDMGGVNDAASAPPSGAYPPAPSGDLLGGGALVPATNQSAAYPGAPAPSYYPSSQPQYPAQAPAAPPAYGAPAPAPQAYPQQSQYPAQAPAFAQPPAAPAPAFAQPPAQTGYSYQQQPPSNGYPPASYPVPTQQY